MNGNSNLLGKIYCFFNGQLNFGKGKEISIPDIYDSEIIDLSRWAKTRQMLADEYGVCVKTLKRMLDRKGINLPKGLICPNDLRKIYAALGLPLKKNDTSPDP